MKFNLHNSLLSLILSVVTIILAYCTQRSDFNQVIGCYAVLFVGYIYIYVQKLSIKEVYFFIGLGVFLRFILIFSMPNLSDDIYRFIWDGRLWLSGINPFEALPSAYIESGNLPKNLTEALYQQLNSPNYFTIYPPVAQGVFVIAAGLSPDNIIGSTIIIKIFLFLFEVGTIAIILQLLKSYQLPIKNILLYALNPLLYLEIVGNLHFEGGMIFFLALALFGLEKGKYNLSAVAFALSVSSKLLPLMFLPFLIHKLGWKKALVYFTIVGLVVLSTFTPLFGTFFLQNFGESLNLYFQKFEFNASFYYIFRWLGYQSFGYNLIGLIGPLLAAVGGIIIVFFALTHQEKNLHSLPKLWLFAITVYLFCTTTIHPWYTALPIFLCLFTRFRYPIIWSGAIFLTYINYSYPVYFENLWIVLAEYLLVGSCLLIEYRSGIKKEGSITPPLF